MKIEWLLIGGPAHLSIAWNLCDSRTMTFVNGQTYYEYVVIKFIRGTTIVFIWLGPKNSKSSKSTMCFI
jgi:hypothetical protein